jgi:hypothetical protein
MIVVRLVKVRVMMYISASRSVCLAMIIDIRVNMEVQLIILEKNPPELKIGRRT